MGVEAELMIEITKNKENKQLRRSVTPGRDIKNSRPVSQKPTVQKPQPSKSKTKLKTDELNKTSQTKKGSKDKRKHLASSKYFGNIFGKATAMEYFKDESYDALNSIPGTKNHSNNQALLGAAVAKILSPSPLKNGNTTGEKKTQSERIIPTQNLNETEFDILKENSPFHMKNSPTKNLFKSEIYNLTKDQFYDMLIKTSEIAQKFPNLKQGLAHLVSQIPLQLLHIQSLKSIYKISVNKDTHSSAAQFHEKCDGLGPYLGFVVHQSGIFGFFIENSFADEFEVYSKSQNNLLFTLRSHLTDRFTCFKVKKDKDQFALCNTEEGFCMGMPTPNNRDLYMNFDDLTKCSSNLGFAYEVGDYPPDALTGKYANWHILDIEILQLVTKAAMLRQKGS